MKRKANWVPGKRPIHDCSWFPSTVYNPAPHFPLAEYAFARLNQAIAGQAAARSFDLADVAERFRGMEDVLISRYRQRRIEDFYVPFGKPIHPNDAGHLRIAEAIRIRLQRFAATGSDGTFPEEWA